MRPEKWEKLVDDINTKFEVEDQGKKRLDEHGGTDIEFIIFKSPLGRVRLEFITKPLVLDVKTTYSRRIGSKTGIEYIYSEDEKTHKLIAYKWDQTQDDWEQINADNFSQ